MDYLRLSNNPAIIDYLFLYEEKKYVTLDLYIGLVT